eukprot:7385113-Prymnesium_polylepis.1
MLYARREDKRRACTTAYISPHALNARVAGAGARRPSGAAQPRGDLLGAVRHPAAARRRARCAGEPTAPQQPTAPTRGA